MLNLLLISLGHLHSCGSRRHRNARLCAWRQIAALIWWMRVSRLSLRFSRPYVLAVPEVLWTSEQIVGYFIGKTAIQPGARHKTKQMFRWLVEEVNGNLVGSGKELKGDGDAEGVRREEANANTPARSYKDGGRSKIFTSEHPSVFNGGQIMFSSPNPRVQTDFFYFFLLSFACFKWWANKAQIFLAQGLSWSNQTL